MERILRETYGLTDFQIKLLIYLKQAILSEGSKIMIMCILFHKQMPLFIFCLILLWLLRMSTGGLHCNHYTSCLIVSVSYLYAVIYLLPHVPTTRLSMLVALSMCIVINFCVGPVTSNQRPALKEDLVIRHRNRACVIILIYLIITYIIPVNPYIISGYWVIILHSMQLLVAKIRKEKKT